MYEFSPTDEQELLMEAADQFMDSCGFDEEYFKRCYDEHRVPEEYYAALKESPFGTLGLPEQFGGVPVDQVTMMLVQERFFRRNFPFNTPVLQIKDAQEFGSEEQLRKVTEALKTKAMAFSLGISEPGAGSDSTCIASTATRRDGKVYLNGTKTFITNAAYCPYILFVTRDLDNPNPYAGMTMWFVDASAPGITMSPMQKIGNKSAPICEVYFDNVEVEESDIFGKENNGFMQLVKIDNMRFQVLQAAWMKDNGKSTQVESGLAKLYNAREAFEVCDMAIQILGGLGYTEESPVGRVWLDARMNRIGGGTDEIIIKSVGKELAKAEAKRLNRR